MVFAYVNRGMSYVALGRREEAIADFRKTLLLDPSNTLAGDGLKLLNAKPW